jgi:predicted ATP-binding protein involved in virulence
LQEIRTHKLFRLFDHVIPLNMDERITIIHGPNGFGKTAILRMIAGTFESRFSALRSLPFDRFDLEFDDGNVLTVDEHVPLEGENGNGVSLDFNYSGNELFRLGRSRAHIAHQLLHLIDDLAPGLQRVGETEWFYQHTGEILDLDDVVDRFGDRIETRFGIRIPEQEQPEWFARLRDSLDVHFIRTNRLERADWEPDRRRSSRRTPTQVVVRYAGELASQIQTTLARYAELSQSLDRSFPGRLVTFPAAPVPEMDRILSKLTELETRRNELTDAGLLDKEEQTQFDVTAPIDKSKADVLSVYIEDVEKKLGVFDNLFARIDLFKKIVSSRFRFKTVSIDKTEGIVFSTPDGKPLPAASLSSGEQHEVVLLYQLLFKVKPQSLILIDEPELSLHIAWQEQFLKDLAQITCLSKFDVLIATHSPQIISDRWDLTVELLGPNGCESTSPTTQSLTR